jgi:hypothetical protein
VGLTGTALAFNNAYGNCRLMLQGTTLQPSHSRLNAEQALAPSKPSAPDKLSRIDLENGAVIVYIRYFQSMGVDAEVVALAATMPSDGIHWIDPERAMELKLIGAVLP